MKNKSCNYPSEMQCYPPLWRGQGKVLVFIFFFHFTQNIFSQNYKLVKTIPVNNLKFFTVDNLDNVYIVSTSNDITKYNRNGDVKFTQNFKIYGNLFSMDVSNPLEIYFFYKDFNTVIYTDNTLAQRGISELANQNIIASAAARSYDNALWIFDMADMQLKKISKENEVLQTSGNSMLFARKNFSPNYIFDNQNRIYISDSSTGIIATDIFANYIKTIPVKLKNSFTILEEKLYYYKNDSLYNYNLQTFETRHQPVPSEAAIVDVKLSKERLYVLKPDGIYIYAL